MSKFWIIIARRDIDVQRNFPNDIPLSFGKTVLLGFTSKEKAEEFLVEADSEISQLVEVWNSGFTTYFIETDIEEMRKHIRQANSQINRYIIDVNPKATGEEILNESFPLI